MKQKMANFIRARVYKKEPSATQSGNKNLNYWILEPIVSISHNPDKLMGWNGGGDVRQQIKLKFSTLKNVEIYAKENGIILEFLNTHERSLKIKSYADNFIRKD